VALTVGEAGNAVFGIVASMVVFVFTAIGRDGLAGAFLKLDLKITDPVIPRISTPTTNTIAHVQTFPKKKGALVADIAKALPQ
jgi:hypothetical protein